MKILHIIIGLEIGGAELMLKRLVELQANSKGFQPEVISLMELGPIGSRLIESGIPVKALGMKSGFGLVRILYQLYKLFKEKQPDIVQTWMYHADLIGGWAAWLAGVRNIIWGIRTTDISEGSGRGTLIVRKMCALLSSTLPSKIVCVAKAALLAHSAEGYDKNKMTVIYNGFDIERLNSTEKEGQDVRLACGFEREHIVIGSVGRFHPVKDQKTFVEAVSLLFDKYHLVRILMIGRDIDYANSLLMKMIEATGHAKYFCLLGERTDVAACMKAMDIFCLHSKTEGFPNVLGEAMCMELPCVTTDVGDAADILGGLGVVVEKNNPNELAIGIEKMVQLPRQKLIEVGKEGRYRIHEKFTMRQTFDKYQKIYRELLML